MASASDPGIYERDESPSMASSDISTTDTFDRRVSLSSRSSDKSGTNDGQHFHPEADERKKDVDYLIYRRINKINKRLKETDANIKTMETLLEWKGKQNSAPWTPATTEPVMPSASPQVQTRHSSTSSQSSVDVFEHSRGNSKQQKLTKSAESLRAYSNLKSPTLEQLQRLTQSMQDLHKFQQRFQDDLKTEMRNISRNENRDVLHELSVFIKQRQEETLNSKEILAKLLELQNELKTSHNHADFRSHVLNLVENLKQDIDYLKSTVPSSPLKAKENGLLQKLSNIESHQEKLENSIDMFVKQIEIQNQSESRKDRMSGLEESQAWNIQQQIHHMSEELQKIQQARNNTDSARESGKQKARQVVQKLKNRCEELLIERRQFEGMCQANEERINSLLREKEMLLIQLDDFQSKFHENQKELQSMKTTFMEDQMHTLKKETILQQFKLLYENNQKSLESCQKELEKMTTANDKLTTENGTLHQQIANLSRETNEQQERLTVTSNSLQELKTTGVSADNYLKEKIKYMEEQFEKSRSEHLKQLNEEKGNTKLLREEILQLKESFTKEISDVALKKEAETGPIIALLKQQILDFQAQMNNLQLENKNLSMEKSQINRELLKIQSEIRDAHKKYEKLLKNYYLKDEELRLKIRQSEDQELNLTDFRKVARKMEQEYKTILSTISSEVDHTLQLWNKTSACTLQVSEPGSGSPVHPKVQFVDISSKLKWIQDDLSALLRNERQLDSAKFAAAFGPLIKTSTHVYQYTDNSSPKLNILSNLSMSDNQIGSFRDKLDVVGNREDNTKKTIRNQALVEISQPGKNQISPPVKHLKSRTEVGIRAKYENNLKQLNSTEIESAALPFNHLASLCRNDISEIKNAGSQSQYRTVSPNVSSITDPSDETSIDN